MIQMANLYKKIYMNLSIMIHVISLMKHIINSIWIWKACMNRTGIMINIWNWEFSRHGFDKFQLFLSA